LAANFAGPPSIPFHFLAMFSGQLYFVLAQPKIFLVKNWVFPSCHREKELQSGGEKRF
jgi:hypothetical protein